MAESIPSPDAMAAAMLDAMAPMLGLSIDAAWRSGAIANLVTLAAIAHLVMDFPLDEDLEPAPVFKA